MSILSDSLNKFKNEKTIIQVYRDDIDDNAQNGLVLDFNDEFIILFLLSTEGTSDGISIIKTADVTDINWELNSLASIEILMREKETKIPELQVDKSSIKTILQSCFSIFGYVSIYTVDDAEKFTLGEIKDIDNDFIWLHQIPTRSTRDRFHSIFRIDRIIRIDVDSEYEQDSVFLMKRLNL
ncbi:MAG: hypothetical protein R3F48_12000 [Candidatus Zixiibacteriota bacterium]